MMGFFIRTNHSQKHTEEGNHEGCNEERYDLKDN